MKKALHLLTLLCFFTVTHAQTWQSLGPDDNNRITPFATYFDNAYPSLFLRNGIPYVSYRDNNSRRAYVKKYESETWQLIGDGPISEGSISYSDITADESAIYIVYTDGNASSKVTVKKYNGKAWQLVGNQGFSAGAAAFTRIINFKNSLFVAYQDASQGNKISVQKFNGETWELIGSAGFSNGASTDISICTDNTSLYVCYRDGSDGNKAVVKKFNSNKWETVGTTSASPGRAVSLAFAINKAVPYVLYMDDSESPKKVVVRKFDGNEWVTVGASISESNIQYCSIAFDGDQPYIAYRAASYAVAFIKRLINNDWESVGYFTMYGNNIQIAFYNRTPFVLSSDKLLEVQKFENDAWKSLGAGTGVGASTIKPALAILNNTPYLAYLDNDTYKVTVKKFNGTSWETILKSGIYARTIAGLTLSTSGNALYLGYVDHQSAIARKYDGSNWQLLSSGTIYSSSLPSWTASFAFDGGSAWVAYDDPDANKKLTVKKVNGSAWVLQGTAGVFTSGGKYKLAANGGAPYLAYVDGVNGNKVSVKKFDGTKWLVVGAVLTPIYSGDHDLSLVFGNNVPYLHFKSNAFPPNFLVKKVSGSGWADVGTARFTTDILSADCELAFGNNQVLALYTDNGAGNKPAVKRSTATSWLGSGWMSVGSASRPTIASDDKNIIAAYDSDGIFVKSMRFDVLAVKIAGVNLKETLAGAVRLDWRVLTSSDSHSFLIERSRDLKEFEEVGRIFSNNRIGTFSFEDLSPIDGISYYRLSEIDVNGVVTELETKSLSSGNSSGKSFVYPNPTTNRIYIKNGKLSGFYHVRLFNSDGAVVQSSYVKFENGIADLSLNSNLAAGLYLVGVDGLSRSYMFTLQK
ncbi:T9SS type A sorting domain-containing protein [Desertivirga brevis]|uniref:T9SS type A sorting domain-containing protein n=1 Tax=Desertivirga brevis TaxID=2810310 RepID=UPI001A9611BA|nr:T9SS type A sorting domain-containing protein [Pedobacter sp. SYSU D00873]